MPDFGARKITFPDCHAIRLSNSGLALLIQLPDREQPVWIPQSQIDDDSEVYKPGDEGTLVVSEWFATQKGLV